MRKTNEELDNLISQHEDKLSEDAEKTDFHRGRISKANGQLVKNRMNAMKTLENRKELTTVKLRSGI